jgi:hypothetical protein
MTYTRHYPFLESIHDALGGDLARTVDFFVRVDRAKPARPAVLKRMKLNDPKSIEFVRAYETIVVETAEKLLKESGTTAAPVRLK